MAFRDILAKLQKKFSYKIKKKLFPDGFVYDLKSCGEAYPYSSIDNLAIDLFLSIYLALSFFLLKDKVYEITGMYIFVNIFNSVANFCSLRRSNNWPTIIPLLNRHLKLENRPIPDFIKYWLFCTIYACFVFIITMLCNLLEYSCLIWWHYFISECNIRYHLDLWGGSSKAIKVFILLKKFSDNCFLTERAYI